MLHNKYKIDEDSTDVAWIYDQYSSQLQRELAASKRLTDKGLQDVVSGLAPLLYENIHAHNHMLTAALYSNTPARHTRSTTWRRLVN